MAGTATETAGGGAMTDNAMKAMRKALRTLGVSGRVSVHEYDSFTVEVYVDDEYFGLWDCDKQTFVE